MVVMTEREGHRDAAFVFGALSLAEVCGAPEEPRRTDVMRHDEDAELTHRSNVWLGLGLNYNEGCGWGPQLNLLCYHGGTSNVSALHFCEHKQCVSGTLPPRLTENKHETYKIIIIHLNSSPLWFIHPLMLTTDHSRCRFMTAKANQQPNPPTPHPRWAISVIIFIWWMYLRYTAWVIIMMKFIAHTDGFWYIHLKKKKYYDHTHVLRISFVFSPWRIAGTPPPSDFAKNASWNICQWY